MLSKTATWCISNSMCNLVRENLTAQARLRFPFPRRLLFEHTPSLPFGKVCSYRHSRILAKRTFSGKAKPNVRRQLIKNRLSTVLF